MTCAAWLEEQFPFRADQRNYLNTCGLGVPPQLVLEDLAQTYMQLARNPHSEFEYEKDIAGYRDYIRALIHDDGELSFTRNVTEGLVIAANAIPFRKGEQIVVTSFEHRAALNCWYLRQVHNPELELEIKIAPISIDATSEQIVESVFAQVTERTRVIAVPHIDRYFGLLFPVAEICARASAMGIITIVDGAQTIGLIDVDLGQINCDIYLSCLHKWYLAPMTIGTISVNRRIFPRLIRSYAAASRWADEKMENRQFGGRELGTRNVPVEKCLGSLIRFHETYDPLVRATANESKARLRAGLLARPRVKVAPAIDQLGRFGITTFAVDGIDTNAIIRELESQHRISVGISSRSSDWVRVSTFFYNTESDVDHLLEALDGIIARH